MDVKLRVTQGKNVGQDVPIPGKKFLIGRAEDCHLRAGSDLISRHHCVIIIEDGYLSVRDFGSKNGSYVNDERVAGECELKHGDQLRVGPLEFTLQVSQGSLSGKKKPPVHDAKEAAARTAASPIDEEPDVARWLSEPAPAVKDSSTAETQMVRTSDTDEIDVGSTREFGLSAAANSADATASSAPSLPAAAKAAPIEPKTAAPVATKTAAPVAPKTAAKPVAVAAKPAVAEPVVHMPRSTAPLTAFVAEPSAQPAAPHSASAQPGTPEPASAVPAPAAEKKGFFGGGKKFGKLPQQPQQGTKDSRSAASDMLDKLRKRR